MTQENETHITEPLENQESEVVPVVEEVVVPADTSEELSETSIPPTAEMPVPETTTTEPLLPVMDKLAELQTLEMDGLEAIGAVAATQEQLSQGLAVVQTMGRNGLEKLDHLNELYSLMSEYKNRATLQLTRFAEVFERIHALNQYCEETFSQAEGLDEAILSLKRRVRNIHRATQRSLESFGIVPIVPERNAEFNPEEHQIMAEKPRETEEDHPGNIAECLKIGLLRDGVVAQAAQVIVFQDSPVPTQENTPEPPETEDTTTLS